MDRFRDPSKFKLFDSHIGRRRNGPITRPVSRQFCVICRPGHMNHRLCLLYELNKLCFIMAIKFQKLLLYGKIPDA